MTNAEYLNELVLVARADHHAYPQYKGHFDKYKLCTVKEDVRGKGGLAFYKGEMTICDPSVHESYADEVRPSRRSFFDRGSIKFRLVYSFRLGYEVSVPEEWVQELPV